MDSNAVRQAAIVGALQVLAPHAQVLSPADVAQRRSVSSVQTSEEWPEDIGYLRIDGLHPGGGAEVESYLDQWLKESRPSIIVDLRSAGGDDLASVDHLAGLFISTTNVLYGIRNGRGEWLEGHAARRGRLLHDRLAVIFLVDAQTTGAAEVLATVLKNQGGIMLVGNRTRGHTILREIVPLSANESLLLSTRWIVWPKEAMQESAGLLPNVVVSNTDPPRGLPSGSGHDGKPLSDKSRMDLELMRRVSHDPVLARATDILLGLKAVDSWKPTPPPTGPLP